MDTNELRDLVAAYHAAPANSPEEDQALEVFLRAYFSVSPSERAALALTLDEFCEGLADLVAAGSTDAASSNRA